jgi:hypothetical protein
MDDMKQIWERIRRGVATEEERFDAAIRAGQLANPRDRPRVSALLGDPSDQVRAEALSTLVLHLDALDAQMEAECWRLLTQDPSETVRSRAAMSLGKILWARPSHEGFRRLVGRLKAEDSQFVKGGLYLALFNAARQPAKTWPGLFGPSRAFRTDDIDWGRVAELEEQVRKIEKS